MNILRKCLFLAIFCSQVMAMIQDDLEAGQQPSCAAASSRGTVEELNAEATQSSSCAAASSTDIEVTQSSCAAEVTTQPKRLTYTNYASPVLYEMLEQQDVIYKMLYVLSHMQHIFSQKHITLPRGRVNDISDEALKVQEVYRHMAQENIQTSFCVIYAKTVCQSFHTVAYIYYHRNPSPEQCQCINGTYFAWKQPPSDDFNRDYFDDLTTHIGNSSDPGEILCALQGYMRRRVTSFLQCG